MVPGIYSSLNGDQKSTSFPGPSLGRSQVPLGSVKVCLLGLFSGKEVVPHTLYVHWLAGLTRALGCPVMQDLLGEDMLGAIEVN